MFNADGLSLFLAHLSTHTPSTITSSNTIEMATTATGATITAMFSELGRGLLFVGDIEVGAVEGRMLREDEGEKESTRLVMDGMGRV